MFKNAYIKIIIPILLLVIFSSNVLAESINSFSKDEEKNVEKNIQDNAESAKINPYIEYANSFYDNIIYDITEEQQVTNLEKANKVISELLTILKDKVTDLDEKVKYIRTTGEYDNYPAIRLNLDTPIFGLSSIIEQRLKISKDVSPNDVASSYSIRSIVQNNYIRLPDVYIAGILISTNEIDLKTDVKLSNSNIIILKLTQYINKVDEIEKFLNNQVSKFFRGYIEKEKLTSISDIESRISRQSQELKNINHVIIKIGILDSEDNRYENYFNEYINLLDRLYDLKDKVSDTLMTAEALNEYKKEIISIESDILSFTTKINSEDIKYENMSYSDVLNIVGNIKLNIEKIKGNIEQYIDNSSYEKEIKLSDDEDTISDQTSEEKLDESKNLTEKVQLYMITNESVISNFDNYLSELENMVKKIEDRMFEGSNGNNEEQESESNENSQSTSNDIDIKKFNQDELDFVNELIDNALRIYKEALSRENRFYLNNINNILKNVTLKITDLSKYTDIYFFDNIKYIFFDIPEILSEYMEKNDSDYISQIRLNNSLNCELDKMIKSYINSDMIYKKIQVDNLKQND